MYKYKVSHLCVFIFNVCYRARLTTEGYYISFFVFLTALARWNLKTQRSTRKMIVEYSIWLFPYLLLIGGVIQVILKLRSPLVKVPGPWYTALTSLFLKNKEFTHGRTFWIQELHERYGPVVRLSPNEVSFATVEAVREIYMSGGSGYNKTPFYSLFKQFGTRTLFSSLPRTEVCLKRA